MTPEYNDDWAIPAVDLTGDGHAVDPSSDDAEAALVEALAEMHPEDIADLVEGLSQEDLGDVRNAVTNQFLRELPDGEGAAINRDVFEVFLEGSEDWDEALDKYRDHEEGLAGRAADDRPAGLDVWLEQKGLTASEFEPYIEGHDGDVAAAATAYEAGERRIQAAAEELHPRRVSLDQAVEEASDDGLFAGHAPYVHKQQGYDTALDAAMGDFMQDLSQENAANAAAKRVVRRADRL